MSITNSRRASQPDPKTRIQDAATQEAPRLWLQAPQPGSRAVPDRRVRAPAGQFVFTPRLEWMPAGGQRVRKIQTRLVVLRLQIRRTAELLDGVRIGVHQRQNEPVTVVCLGIRRIAPDRLFEMKRRFGVVLPSRE